MIEAVTTRPTPPPAISPNRRVSPLLIGLLAGVLAAVIFAGVALAIGFTRGSPSADKQRVETLKDELDDARASHASALDDAKDAVTKAAKFNAIFAQMNSIAQQTQVAAAQAQSAGAAGNVPLYNQYAAQLLALLDQHNSAEAQLDDLPRP